MEWQGSTIKFAGYTGIIGGGGKRWVAEVQQGGATLARWHGIKSEAKARAAVESYLNKSDDMDRARFAAALREREAIEAALRERAKTHAASGADDRLGEVTALLELLRERQASALAAEDERQRLRDAAMWPTARDGAK